MLQNFIKIAHSWQELLGSIIGATTPLVYWLLGQWYQKQKEKRENLVFLEKVLVHQINNLIDIRQTLKDFFEYKIKELLMHIEANTKEGRYAVDITFYPLFSVNMLDDSLYKIDSGSGYLDNKLNQLVRMSRDFKLSIDDSRRQFENTIQQNHTMCLMKLNSQTAQNEVFKENIESFDRIMKESLIDKNIKIYLKNVAETRAVVSVLREKGFFFWKRKFQYITFKFFLRYSDIRKYRKEAFSRIDKYVEPVVKKFMEEIGGLMK